MNAAYPSLIEIDRGNYFLFNRAFIGRTRFDFSGNDTSTLEQKINGIVGRDYYHIDFIIFLIKGAKL